MAMPLHDIKIYQINASFYEFDTIATQEGKVQYIVDSHRTSIDNLGEVGHALAEMEIDNVKYQFYIFNQIERQSSWRTFLPEAIVGEEDFNVQTASFVLFAIVGAKIFAVIGGSGLVVIVRYLNHTFGLDLYEKISNPEEDIVNSMESRGITGNLASQKENYRKDHRLIDTLSFTRIPVRLNIQLRDVLIADVFDFLNISQEDKAFAEIGKSFFIKCKMSFEQTHQMILKINDILELNNSTPLSRYERIRDENLINNSLRLDLYTKIRDDMMLRIPPGSNANAPHFDHDFVHPSKLEKFYECDTYKLFARNEKIAFYSTSDRTTLYDEGLRYLYEKAEPNQGDFNFIISGIRVKGYLNDEVKTHAMFTHHLTCEILYLARPVFLIDDKWYKVRGDFIQAINEQCVSMLRLHNWNTTVMRIWQAAMPDEDDYNTQYEVVPSFIVLDKVLGQNIELCDLMYEDGTTLYLIHVKRGFNAKMRDLSNQVTISATRLWNDIKSARFEFVDAISDAYNDKVEAHQQIPTEEFRNKFNKEIVYVMAFNSELSQNRRVTDHMQDVRSNIAKFCLVQVVREMQNSNYQLKIFEIQNN